MCFIWGCNLLDTKLFLKLGINTDNEVCARLKAKDQCLKFEVLTFQIVHKIMLNLISNYQTLQD